MLETHWRGTTVGIVLALGTPIVALGQAARGTSAVRAVSEELVHARTDDGIVDTGRQSVQLHGAPRPLLPSGKPPPPRDLPPGQFRPFTPHPLR